MFRLRSSQTVQRPLRRAGLLALALAVLWIATRFFTTSVPPPPTDVPEEATAARVTEGAERASLFRPGYLAAFALLAGGAGFALYLRRRNGEASPTREMLRSVGKLQLGPGQQVHLVSCGDELLVIGATNANVTLLKSFPAPTASTPATASVPDARPYRHQQVVTSPAATAGGDGAPFDELLRRFGAPTAQEATPTLT